ncbi:conserved hypothetical protein [Ricinus communis]|uniref:Retrotransposon Copia-like N-terminal domain-containing protein n=1 Tax=Ricinus communis TaxID=3988 RepID=B9T813_RICCO|nr:conserved hypothetical protein [Ricinus communis]
MAHFVVSPSFPVVTQINPFDDASSPYFLHHTENHSSVILTPELTAINYTSWRSSFLLAISIRNKQDFLNGSTIKPPIQDPIFQSWKRCNNLLIAWLLCSISPMIAPTVFYMDDAKQIWESRICYL